MVCTDSACSFKGWGQYRRNHMWGIFRRCTKCL